MFDESFAIVDEFGIDRGAEQFVLLNAPIARKENSKDHSSGEMHDALTA